MANKYRSSFLTIFLLALMSCGILLGCKQVEVPSDSDLIKAFQDNSKAFDEAAALVMAEPNQNYSVFLNKGITYQGSDKPPVSAKTELACRQVMRRSFSLAMRRTGRTAQFVFFEEQQNDAFRGKSLIYDLDNFKDPRWAAGGTGNIEVRYVPIEPMDKDSGSTQKRVGSWRLEYQYQKKAH